MRSPKELVSRSSKWRKWLSQNLNSDQSKELISSWAFSARHNQVIPEGDWRLWLCLTGKGWGKNRVMSEFAHEKAAAHPDFAGFLAARTTEDVKKTIIGDTESGLIVTQRADNPCELKTHPTSHVQWANGAHADIHTSDEPDRARGKNYLWGILDEIATWRRTVDFEGNDCFTNLDFSLRAGKRKNLRAQAVAGTTPRPSKLIRELIAQAKTDPSMKISTGTMYDNAANLADGYIEAIERKHKGTRLFRQEAMGELLLDLEDAILTTEMLDASRVEEAPEMQRVVVGVDPALKKKKKSDMTGINAAGIGVDGDLYSLANRSCKMSPDGWSRRVVDTCREFDTHTVVAEDNVIGDAITTLLRAHDSTLRVLQRTAKRSKVKRAEPILAYYERGEAHIVGDQSGLEDQLVQFTPLGWDGDGSPDDADAHVWAATELMLRGQATWGQMAAINA